MKKHVVSLRGSPHRGVCGHYILMDHRLRAGESFTVEDDVNDSPAAGRRPGRGLYRRFLRPGEAQPRIRRDPSVQHISVVRKGDFLLGVGAGYEADGRFPLAAVEGDIIRLGTLTLAYGLAEGILVELPGDAYRELTVDQMGTPLVETNASLAAGKAGGGGDFRVGMLFRLLGAATGLSGGAHLEFSLTTEN